MGLGQRFSLKIDKKFEQNPGPGAYTDINLDSIEMKMYRSRRDTSTNSRLAFGASKEQNDKLQGFGQERHFLGREGASPGAYEMPRIGIGANSALKNSKLSIPKGDRGLLPVSTEKQAAKSLLYNNSHAQVSPASYNSSVDLMSKSVLKNNKSFAK